jgi:hypothetical protein
MSDRALTSLAVLKVNWDEGKDYIGNYIPFLKKVLVESSSESLSSRDIQLSFEDEFGLNIPVGALETILNRAAKKGLINKQRNKYYPRREKLASTSFDKRRGEVIREKNYLLKEFVSYCSDEFNKSYSDRRAEEILLSFIDNNSSDILASIIDDDPIIDPSDGDSVGQYHIASFFQYASKHNPDIYGFFEDLTKGWIFANAVMYPDLGTIEEKLVNVDVFLDTPFLLRVLSLAPEPQQKPAKEMVDLVYQLNANIFCFKHTIDELRRVLKRITQSLKSGDYPSRYSDTYNYLESIGRTPSDILLLRKNLKKRLSRKRISIKTVNVDIENGETCDVIERALRDEIGYLNEQALNHDLRSVYSIHRLRKAGAPSKLSHSKAVFVTTNDALAKADKDILNELGLTNVIPHVYTSRIFTTAIWLKDPEKKPNLPRMQILSDCYAALNPEDELWVKYLDEIEKLEDEGSIGEESVFLLRKSSIAKDVLMEQTGGSSDSFTDQTVDDVLEKTKERIRKPDKVTIRKKEKENEEIRNELEKFKAKREDTRERISDISNIIAQNTIFIVKIFIFLVLVSGAVLSPFYTPSFSSNRIFPYIASIVFLVFMGFAGINMWFGTTINSALRKLEVLLSTKIFALLTGLTAFEDDDG